MNPEKLKDRLIANIYSAGIPASANDIERVISQECLERVISLQKMSETVDRSANPDYLADWDLLRPLNRSTTHENGVHLTLQETSSDETLTIGQLSRRIKDRQISPVELTKQTLTRITEKDPQLNAFQSVLTDQALRAAEQAEAEIRAGRYRGPLHGIPVAIKDLIAMTGTIRTAGSKILNNQISNFNAGAVDRLLKAGAIIIGKTRLSEFAYWPGSSNPHYGPTSNPHNFDYDAGGSSSGSGAAVAAGIVCAALGSDTGGSIRIPATLCGLVGLKATFGRVSLSGCTPLAWSLDHLGPLTANVEDSALLLSVLAGHDPLDSRTRKNSEFTVPADLNAGINGLRIGILREDGFSQPVNDGEMLDSWNTTLTLLEDSGAELVEIDLEDISTLWLTSNAILAVEAATFHTPNLIEHYQDYGRFCKDRLLAAFAFSGEDFVQAQKIRRVIRNKWDQLLQDFDLILTHSQPDRTPLIGEPSSTRFMNSFNILGWPAISVPMGKNREGLPLGIQLVAKPWKEGLLLRAAQTLESSQ